MSLLRIPKLAFRLDAVTQSTQERSQNDDPSSKGHQASQEKTSNLIPPGNINKLPTIQPGRSTGWRIVHPRIIRVVGRRSVDKPDTQQKGGDGNAGNDRALADAVEDLGETALFEWAEWRRSRMRTWTERDGF